MIINLRGQGSNQIKIYNAWLINPFFAYSLVWTVVIFLYALSPAKINLPLNQGLLAFFLITIIISAACGVFFSKKFQGKVFKVKVPHFSVALLFAIIALYCLEFIYSGNIPLLFYLFFNDDIMASDVYMNFGIPTLHVLIVTFSIFYCIYCFLLFIVTRNLKFLIPSGVCILYFVLIFSRGALVFIACALVIIYFAGRPIYLRHALLIALLAFVAAMLFGIFGNIRSGYAWNDSYAIMGIAKIEGDRYGFFSPLYWVEEYIVCSFRNLNYNVSLENNITYDTSDLITALVIDFVSKRIVTNDISFSLVVPALSTGTMYILPYRAMGYLGMTLNFIIYCLAALIVACSKMRNFECKVVCLALMFGLYVLSPFDNMLWYSGYSFALFIGYIYGYVKINTSRKQKPKSNRLRIVLRKPV